MTFIENEHPRAAAGVFTDKTQSEPETAPLSFAPLSQDGYRDHFQEISDEAGLGGVMPGILQVLLDREVLSEEKFVALTSEDVTNIYEGLIAPAIDRAEQYLAND
jgi:hypothetical protein